MAYAAFFPITLSTIIAIAPSPVTFAAVPKLSWAIYKPIMRPRAVSSKPSIVLKRPKAAITAPPGTPGAAIIMIPSIKIKGIIIPKLGISKLFDKTMTATEQRTRVIVLPDRWIVAHKGTAESATPSLTSFDFVERTVTGMVAALDIVPRPVK